MTRLLAEQERSVCRQTVDTAEEREKRIRGWIAHYERLGVRGHQGPSKPAVERSPAEAARRRDMDARCLQMRRDGMRTEDIAKTVGMGRTTVHEACKRAEERERRARESCEECSHKNDENSHESRAA